MQQRHLKLKITPYPSIMISVHCTVIISAPADPLWLNLGASYAFFASTPQFHTSVSHKYRTFSAPKSLSSTPKPLSSIPKSLSSTPEPLSSTHSPQFHTKYPSVPHTPLSFTLKTPQLNTKKASPKNLKRHMSLSFRLQNLIVHLWLNKFRQF